ncbi:carboxypeptidase-like regulatory domain-containing protein [Schlesneria sp.]|uniref:carboxypeptidase-like regulatory domain-containing protein n=1 Tax=Schlesneria sp. TaxID=2762018 RepID=UPI002F034B8A
MTPLTLAVRWTCVASLVFTIGCGGSAGPKLAPVSGVVTAGDEPFEGGLVRFVPKPGTNLNSREAVTDAEGKYKIEFFKGKPGLEPGEYKIMFSLYQMPDGSPAPDQSDEQDPKHPNELGAVQFVAPEFETGKAPACEVTVPPEGGQFDFELPPLKAQPTKLGNKSARR